MLDHMINDLYKIEKHNIPEQYQNQSDKFLRELAHDIYRGTKFCSRQVDSSNLASCFMVWALLNPLEKKKCIDQGMSMMWAEMSEAMPRSINGYPCFGSMRMLNRHDDLKVYEYYKQICKKMDDFKGDFYYDEE
jgi:hypothetical protein